MSKARNLARLIVDSSGDVDSSALGNVPPSDDASALTTGTLPIARIADGAVVNAKLGSDIDASKITAGTLPIARIADGAVTMTKLSATGTAGSSTFLRGDGSWQSPGGGGGRGQAFTSSGTFTVPDGVTAVKVTVIGGGGGSGGTNYNSYWGGSDSSGGGGGGASIRYITGLTPGSTVSVTVGAGGTAGTPSAAGGAGGTSSFGAFCSATGGGGTVVGFYSSGTYSNPARGTPGAGSGGGININGGTLGDRRVGGQAFIMSVGGGTLAATNGNPSAGFSGVGFGAGGGGSGYFNSSGGSTQSNNGAAGTGGLVLVEW
jgi:hypothetical protein